jgi:hypothetical protein
MIFPLKNEHETAVLILTQDEREGGSEAIRRNASFLVSIDSGTAFPTTF